MWRKFDKMLERLIVIIVIITVCGYLMARSSFIHKQRVGYVKCEGMY